MEGYNILRHLVKSIIPNAIPSKIPSSMNLVFDGGAFNGFYGLGVGLYIKQLEAEGLTKINKISGVSAGSVLGLWYLLENPKSDLNELFVEMSEHFNKNYNLRIFKQQIKKVIKTNIQTDDLSFLNDRLFISYYDTFDCTRKTVSKYKNRKHLIDVIVRSSHIPFMITDSIAYKDRYIDGVRPELFNNESRSLFVKLTTINRLSTMFSTGSEVNILYRCIVGLADANDFFTTGSSDMCSFTDEWSRFGKLLFCFREIAVCILYLLLSKIVYGQNSPFKFINGLKSASIHIPWALS